MADLPTSAFAVRADLAYRSKLARRDFSTYIALCARDNYGNPMRQAILHRSWQGHIFWCWARALHPIILSPWGGGKTIQLAVEFGVWHLGRNPDSRVSVISNVEPNAKKRVAASAARITGRAATQLVFPHLRLAKGAKSKFHFSLAGTSASPVDPSYQAWGVFGSGVGTRMDLALFDDIIDQNNAIREPAKRKAMVDQVDSTWWSRLEPPCPDCEGTGVVGGLAAYTWGEHERCRNCGGTGGGRSISIGTVWHREDYWHHRMGDVGFCTLLQRVDDTHTGYECEVYGVPEGHTYPTLEELCCIGSPRELHQSILDDLAGQQLQREALEGLRRAVA